jgi:hypothetical protein
MHNQIQLTSAGPIDALVRSEISAIAQPYQRYLEGWQLRATYLGTQLAAHPVNSNEHDLALRRLEELRAEIEANRDYLVVETSGLPPDDLVDTTLDSLDELLATVSRLAS